MKALSIKEPWAGMINRRIKPIETRTWATKYRGKVLLCASKKPESDLSGKAFAIAELVDCKPMTKEHEAAACCEVYPRAVSWFLENVQPIKPFPVQGKLGLFEIDVLECELSPYQDQVLQECYDRGYDSIKNGANQINCNFALFTSPEKTAAWEKGRAKAQQEMKR